MQDDILGTEPIDEILLREFANRWGGLNGTPVTRVNPRFTRAYDTPNSISAYKVTHSSGKYMKLVFSPTRTRAQGIVVATDGRYRHVRARDTSVSRMKCIDHLSLGYEEVVDESTDRWNELMRVVMESRCEKK